jgi:hypothetical protein
MLERHTFRTLIETIALNEVGIKSFENAVGCQIDDNWMTRSSSSIIRALSDGFFDKVPEEGTLEYRRSEVIEELLYHFIYMEDCGNDSEHCREKLVRVSNDNNEETALPCTSIDELYTIIYTYLAREDLNFHFNYCHSSRDEEIKDAC